MKVAKTKIVRFYYKKGISRIAKRNNVIGSLLITYLVFLTFFKFTI